MSKKTAVWWRGLAVVVCQGIGSDVICLQELWVAEQEMVDMYQR